LISSIHDYCDRWCERCTLTSHCAIFEPQDEISRDPRNRDMRNGRFWRNLFDILHSTQDMVREMAEAHGIDLDADDFEAAEAEEAAEEARREAADSHECARAAKAYSRRAQQWLDAADALLAEKERELQQVARLELPGRNPREEAATIRDAIDIVGWYHHLICTKLHRALWGEAGEIPAGLEDEPKDSDGSAKVALLGMDRSIAAWGALRDHFPERANEILDILINLDRLRRRTEKEFPDARTFVRPGFDEGV